MTYATTYQPATLEPSPPVRNVPANYPANYPAEYSPNKKRFHNQSEPTGEPGAVGSPANQLDFFV